MGNIARREFLKYAPMAAGAVAHVAASNGDRRASAESEAGAEQAVVEISGADYVPVPDYPIQPQRYADVRRVGDFHDGGAADNVSYWASSQQTADMAVHIDFADLGRQHGDDKDLPRGV